MSVNPLTQRQEIEALIEAMDRDTSFRSSQSGLAWPRLKEVIRSLEEDKRVCVEALSAAILVMDEELKNEQAANAAKQILSKLSHD